MERRLFEPSYPKRNIEALLQQVDAAIGKGQLDADGRMSFDVVDDDRREEASAEKIRDRNPEKPGGSTLLVAHLAIRLVDLHRDLIAPLKVDGARVGRSNVPRGSLKESNAEVEFESRNALTRHLLGHTKRNGRAREASLAHDGSKNEHVVGVDNCHAGADSMSILSRIVEHV
jgi:hypothetical protein